MAEDKLFTTANVSDIPTSSTLSPNRNPATPQSSPKRADKKMAFAPDWL